MGQKPSPDVLMSDLAKKKQPKLTPEQERMYGLGKKEPAGAKEDDEFVRSRLRIAKLVHLCAHVSALEAQSENNTLPVLRC